MTAQPSSLVAVPELPDKSRALWYGTSVNPILCLLGKGAVNVALMPEDLICLARVRYHGKWEMDVSEVRAEEHPDLLLDAADGVVDIFLSSVNKAEVADVLDRAVKMSSTKVIVVIVNGDAPDVKWEAPEDWSCIQQEVLWA